MLHQFCLSSFHKQELSVGKLRNSVFVCISDLLREVIFQLEEIKNMVKVHNDTEETQLVLMNAHTVILDIKALMRDMIPMTPQASVHTWNNCCRPVTAARGKSSIEVSCSHAVYIYYHKAMKTW